MIFYSSLCSLIILGGDIFVKLWFAVLGLHRWPACSSCCLLIDFMLYIISMHVDCSCLQYLLFVDRLAMWLKCRQCWSRTFWARTVMLWPACRGIIRCWWQFLLMTNFIEQKLVRQNSRNRLHQLRYEQKFAGWTIFSCSTACIQEWYKFCIAIPVLLLSTFPWHWIAYIVVWPTTSCYADWSKRDHVTLVIIGRCTLERLTVQHFSIALHMLHGYFR